MSNEIEYSNGEENGIPHYTEEPAHQIGADKFLALASVIAEVDEHALALLYEGVEMPMTVQEVQSLMQHNMTVLGRIGTDPKLWRMYLINIASSIVRAIVGIDAMQQRVEFIDAMRPVSEAARAEQERSTIDAR